MPSNASLLTVLILLASVSTADVANAALVARAEVIGCPSLYTAAQGRCTLRLSDSRGWYTSEAVCRYTGGHLASFNTAKEASIYLTSNLTYAWTGLYHDGISWKWSSGEEMSREVLELLPRERPSNYPVCGILRYSEGSIRITPGACGSSLPALCGIGAGGCTWSKLPLTFFGSFGDREQRLLHISKTGVLSSEGKEIGLGRWAAPNVFEVISPAGMSCNWLAVFSKGSVTSGCQYSAGFDIYNAYKGEWKDLPDCTVNLKPDTPEPTKPFGPPPFTPVPTPGPPVTIVTPPPPIPIIATEAPLNDSDVPKWLWPVALAAVVGVSVVVSVGVATRGKQGKEVAYDNVIAAEDVCHPLNCETCRKFDEDMARNRLKAIHDALAKQLNQPLAINSVSIRPAGSGIHQHVFDVQHVYDAHALNALATAYARAKPNLPKNTRMHVTHNEHPTQPDDCEPTALSDDDELYYTGPTYY